MWNPTEESKQDNVCISEESNRINSHGIDLDSHNKDKESNSGLESGIDSGFLSGPQVSLFDSAEAFPSSSDGVRKQNQDPEVVRHTIPKVITDNRSHLDSGCIDDEGYSSKGFVQQQKQESDEMILDIGVDSGLSEWFCSLSLKSADQPFNNLNQSGQKIDGLKKSNLGEATALKKGNGDKQPWEIYYQQNNEGDTQLHIAIILGYTEVVYALIRMAIHPCLLDIQNDNAQCAAHLAVLTGQNEILRKLLVAGAKATIRDRNGNTALHLACISGDLDAVKALTVPITGAELAETHIRPIPIKNDDDNKSKIKQYPSLLHRCAQLPPDMEQRNYDGKHFVHLASEGNHLDILRHIVWFGADINAREGKTGQTPLHYAIEESNEVLANFLLSECKQLKLETPTYGGLTAYQIAAQYNNKRFLNDLEKFGAEPLTPPSSDIESDLDSDFEDATTSISHQVSLPVN